MIACLGMLCQGNQLQAQSSVAVHPPKPEHGDTLTITYQAGQDTASWDQLYLTFPRTNMFTLPDRLPMSAEDRTWRVGFNIPGYADYIKYAVENADGKKLASGDQLIYKEGIPLKGALDRKMLYEYHPSLNNLTAEQRDSVKLHYYRQINQYYPDDFGSKVNIMAMTAPGDSAARAEVRQKIREKMEKRSRQNPGSRETFVALVEGYEALGKEEVSDSLRMALAQKYPRSEVAAMHYAGKARDTENSSESAQYYKKVLKADGHPRYRIRAYRELFLHYAEKGKADSALTFASKWYNSRYPAKARVGERVSRTLAEDSLWLDRALEYAEKGLQHVEDEPYAPWLRDPDTYYEHYADSAKLENFRRDLRADLNANRGYIHWQQENPQKAEEILKRILEDHSDHERSKKYLASVYMKTGRPEMAFRLYKELLMDNPANQSYRQKIRKAYVRENGTEEGLDREIAAIDSVWRRQAREKFEKNRLDESLPLLKTVTTLQGDTLRSSDLKGKVAVIDFWETWCSPCKEAFPHLQNVYEKYKDHPKVRFLILNSAWSDTLEEARSWMEQQDYSFPVYFDHNSSTADAYGVRGLPTTMVLGPENRLQFKKMGFHGPILENKLTLQIDMLLEDGID